MEDKPSVGDVWVGDGEERGERIVTCVEVPLAPGDDYRVALDGSTLSHLGWWYDQGWVEKE